MDNAGADLYEIEKALNHELEGFALAAQEQWNAIDAFLQKPTTEVMLQLSGSIVLLAFAAPLLLSPPAMFSVTSGLALSLDLIVGSTGVGVSFTQIPNAFSDDKSQYLKTKEAIDTGLSLSNVNAAALMAVQLAADQPFDHSLHRAKLVSSVVELLNILPLLAKDEDAARTMYDLTQASKGIFDNQSPTEAPPQSNSQPPKIKAPAHRARSTSSTSEVQDHFKEIEHQMEKIRRESEERNKAYLKQAKEQQKRLDELAEQTKREAEKRKKEAEMIMEEAKRKADAEAKKLAELQMQKAREAEDMQRAYNQAAEDHRRGGISASGGGGSLEGARAKEEILTNKMP
ncbi:hypothetical protein [Pseudomonas sp. ACM7]|uniref:hypothetical protein n=1 Tax=Pseudomonas sp. ACM7 TaxID=2052956 RepID=UPI0010104310|nr:hypothetical protein [Pseudomonas sp. ACM7]QAY91251.1 hypothetical protein CUN63_15515 [Pseudomonas sp. ACM7]